MSFGKRLVGALAGLAALAAGLVGASTAYAAPDPIVLSSSEAVTPSNYTAYRLTGYQDPVVASPATTPGSLSSVAPSKVSGAVENTIAAALHSAGVTATPTAPATGVDDAGFTIEDHQFSTDPVVDASGVITSAGTANSDSLIGRWSGETLVVTYDATVLKLGASNRVDSTTTDYAGHTHDNPGENPHNGNSIPSLASMTKVSASDQNQGLEGAEFVLTDNGVTAADGPRYMKYTPAMDSEMTKWIHVAAASEAVAPKLQTGSDGKISFDGLGEGTYRLHETKAPSGYLYGGVFIEDVMITVKADSSVETTPVAGVSSGLYVAGDAGVAQTRDVSGALTGGQAHTFKLKNMNSIAQLPATGGAGVIAGVILVALLALIGWGSVEAGRRLRARQRQ